ncbi:MAG: hypothetical protein ABIW30_02055 [Arenimonas sp.]
MPRWLWAVLIVSLVSLWGVGQRNAAPLAATSPDGAISTCPPPPAVAHGRQAVQSEVPRTMSPFRLGAATVSPLAGFSVEARVLSRENYSFGAEASYSPTDLALGWGAMAAPGLAEQLHVTQSGRWYRYDWGREGPPMEAAQIANHSANMHMVPADATVARALARIDAGNIVRVNGWLIRIDGDNGWHWQSSLSRDDTGAGACELVYVCSIETR